jgi:membrane-bound serine protease (ClpP class)
MLAEAAVLESRAFTDVEARSATPPLVDFAATDLPDLLRQLDGRTVTRFDGRTAMIHTSGAAVVNIPMSKRQRFLGTIADPQIAYLLLMLGMLGLTVEIWNPGAILPGVAGGLCLLLAFFAFQILSVSATGVALIVFGIGLLILELKVPSFGALGVGGTVSLVIGSMMVTRQVPGVVVGLNVILPVALVLAGGMLLLGRLALAAQRQLPVTGADGLLGLRARARTAFAPPATGLVDVHGEIWQAISDVPIDAGALVRVSALNGLTLTVVPDHPSPHEGEAP